MPAASVNQMLPSGPQIRLAGAAGRVERIEDLFIDRAVLDDLVGRALGDPEVSGRGIDQDSDRDPVIVIGATALPVVAGLKLTIWFEAGSVIQNSCSTSSQAIAVGCRAERGQGRLGDRGRSSGLNSPIAFDRAVSVNQMLPLRPRPSDRDPAAAAGWAAVGRWRREFRERVYGVDLSRRVEHPDLTISHRWYLCTTGRHPG